MVDSHFVRDLRELVNLLEPGLEAVTDWVSGGTNPVEVLEADKSRGESVLVGLQITTRSPLGAIAHGTGGLLVDHGWIRVLGAGCKRLPRDLLTWNGILAPGETGTRCPGLLLLGDDVLGGFFALGHHGAAERPPTVLYFAPDTLQWEDTQRGYSDWIYWLCSGDLEKYYEGQRWPGWESDVATLGENSGYLVYPFLWAEGPPISERVRRAVPLHELWELQAAQFATERSGT